ncbi:hypothetical protein BpHYR1_042134 [Brachionus plicatilis]|uniref:SWIM-type domain-containing protein n=1 Tax=Brachionus plicatilis TaxID=10195 RepID=A0A3M7R2Z4_BRAPC|nr:hypothetical protein BpHYR1_042134 [Brachionus plicatilis]
MPKKNIWKLVEKFENESTVTKYFEELPTTRMLNRKRVNCSICKVSTIFRTYRKFTSKQCSQKCDVQYRIDNCYNTKTINIYSCGSHLIPELNNSNEDEILRKGISFDCKERIEKIIYEKNIVKPKKIHIDLILNQEEYMLNSIPSLLKIQNFVKYRRIKLGDVNSMVGVVEFIKNLNVDSMDDLIIFGVPVKNGSYVLGSGSDDDHFHMGFTSEKLIRRLKEAEVFHVDATYKIIKKSNPLIFFGYTDISRKFHPVCYMITSHECEEDYLHFFKSLNEIALSFGICFNPTLYSNCLSIMCFFHLMQNVKKQTTKIQEESRKEIYKDVYKMRDTKSLQEFQSTKTKILSKWKKKGFSDFAEVKFDILSVIEIFVNVVKFESKSCKQPKEIPKLKQKDVSYSKVVLKSKKFEKVSNTNGLTVFKYRHKNNNIDYIEISDPECNCLECNTCSCVKYLDIGTCPYLIAALIC